LLNQQLLRSLQQAQYTPLNKGHFGLAAQSYCHFTSPIRRYPDLQVHRTLKIALEKGVCKAEGPSEKLIALGEECSAKERRALSAERNLLELRRCQLMQDKIGEVFPGIISSVAEFGFFVELDEQFVEGLVHVRSLSGDYYYFEPTQHVLIGERRRLEFRIGMPVAVRVEKVELWRRRVDFSLVEHGRQSLI
ncbi:RNB domain-containing ribonuclease, partial [Malonomonas rubra]|uniref:RNB domain-containing ribonuclease n=1 Tax=Malonomonas rubra TaxID=57040 RepID=UPI0026F28EC0